MANGFLNGKLEQNGASDYTPKPGNETTAASYGLEKFFPVQSTKPSLAPNPMERDDELRNVDQPLLEITETYAPTWAYQSRAYPDSTGWHLANLLGRDTSNGYAVVSGSSNNDLAGTALTSTQYKHTWTAPFGPAGSLPQTAKLGWAYTDQSTYYEARGCATEQFEIDTPDTGGAQIKASGPALYLNRVANAAAITSTSPTYETISVRPFTQANLAVTYSGTNAPSSPSPASGFTVQINNPVAAVQTLGVASLWPDRMEKDAGVIMATGTIEKRNLTDAEWQAMRDLNVFTITALWQSSQFITGSSGAKYGLQIAINAQLVGGDMDDLDNKRRHGASYNWKAVYDGTNPAFTVTLVNATPTYRA